MALMAAPAAANERPFIKQALKPQTNERGLTVSFFLQSNIRQMVRNPFSPENLSRVSADVQRPPQRGVQVELLTPGDFGVTVHVRW
jgi:hypothetical protein